MSTSPFLRIAQLTYVVGMMALAALGTAAGFFDVKQPHLWGVEEDATRPPLTAASLYHETFQRGFVPWFEQHWGMRGYAVKTDNTAVERLFGENRRSQSLVVGEHGVLFSAEDIAYVNRSDGPEATIAAAEKIARVQKKLHGIGKPMVLVLVPSKTSIVRNAVPERWRRKGAFARSDENLYGAFVHTLEANGAKFVDGRAMLGRPALDGKVFARTGRHWRMGPACEIFRAAVDLARPDMPELGDENVDCTQEPWPDAPVEEEDYDLFRLRNVWDERPSDIGVMRLPRKPTPDPPGLGAIPTLLVGSSFTFKFVRILNERDVLHPSLFYYYDRSIVDTKTLAITGKVEPYTPGWRKQTFGKRLFIVTILETFLPVDEENFFEEMETAIDRAETTP